MKIALIHDHITCKAGGEQVLLTFHKAFPKAPIYTLAYNPDTTFPEFRQCDIRTSWMQFITKKERLVKKLFFPLGIFAMRSIYLDEYDVVLISGTHCAKYIRVASKTLVITYCFTPFRLAWDPTSYSEYKDSSGLSKIIFDNIIKVMRYLDKKYAQRTDFFLAMTQETKERIKSSYVPKNEVEVISPPVNHLADFRVTNTPKTYFLLVSRLEYYKKVDLVIKAFNTLGNKLIIVGKGSKEAELKQMISNKNIVLKKDLSTKELSDLYSNCRAFIFPQHEDYGLTALEANAAGRPVIAYGKGGILDTQVKFEKDMSVATAIFFHHQDESSICNAIRLFENVEDIVNPTFIRSHAEKFSEDRFIEQIKDFIKKKKALS